LTRDEQRNDFGVFATPLLPNATHPLEANDNGSEISDRARVVLLPVDPYLIHPYWTVSPENVAKAGPSLGKEYGGIPNMSVPWRSTGSSKQSPRPTSPLLFVLDNLVADSVDFGLTFSLTPTLASMLDDPFL
jgi:hypothetical protein